MIATPTAPMPIHHLSDTSLERIERRLEEGYRMIEERRERGFDVTNLEDFWITLLHEYESMYDALPRAA